MRNNVSDLVAKQNGLVDQDDVEVPNHKRRDLKARGQILHEVRVIAEQPFYWKAVDKDGSIELVQRFTDSSGEKYIFDNIGDGQALVEKLEAAKNNPSSGRRGFNKVSLCYIWRK